MRSESDIFDIKSLTGNAALRRMQDYYILGPDGLKIAHDIRIMDGTPDWVKKLVPDFEQKFKVWMSMSTVAVPIDQIPDFSSKTFVNLIDNQTYANGRISKQRCYDTSSEEAEVVKNKQPGRGRRPIQSERPSKSRSYGVYPSFGTCLQCTLEVPVADQQGNASSLREYCIKLFGNNIQVPGCTTEDFRDINQIVKLLDEILQKIYGDLPEIPSMLHEIQEGLARRLLGELTFLSSPEKPFELNPKDVLIYSRNYNIHYLPLTESEKTDNPLSIDPIELFTFLQDNPDLIIQWLQEAGLHAVAIEHQPDSENTNRRFQFLLIAPKTIPDPKNKHISKIFFEISGKVAINLANNYYWEDIIWRFIIFVTKIFSVVTLKPKYINPSKFALIRPPLTDDDFDDYLKNIVEKIC